MMTTSMNSGAVNNDADLVNATLAGSRDAFGQIVSRYQSLICSLAFSATGSLGQSEDLAQETFITAWKHLGHLREREKLRSWLCGIARNRINNFLRREGREPVRAAEPLDTAAESRSPEPLPVDNAISKEEEAILWRSLERIPPIYREPLVLFYREHQSVEVVADRLELTPETVHQRLSRGRKLLQEQVLAFVEGALRRTNPGKAFTLGVLATLPALTFSAKAAVVGATAAKGSLAAKSALGGGFLAAMASPLLIVLGNYAGYRMNLDLAQSPEERQRVKSAYQLLVWVVLAFMVMIQGIVLWAVWNRQEASGRVETAVPLLVGGLLAFFLLCLLVLAIRNQRRRKTRLAGLLARTELDKIPAPAWEYRSARKICGLPLVHICVGDRFAALRPPTTAWIAVGERAVGGLFAFGGMALAPISVGGLGVGLVSFSGLGVGLLALGGLAFGGWAVGGLALGWQAFGGCALAWNTAMGGLAVAHNFALGAFASAAQSGNGLAQNAVDSSRFFTVARIISDYSLLTNLIWVLPIILWWRTVRKHTRQQNF
jgi:RNA polymerase sigma factor (sigma-70 family)